MMKNALLLAALGLLAGCGRVGPPQAPGPTDQIIFPRAYPRPDIPAIGGAGAGTAVPPTVLPPVPLTVPTR